MVGENPNNKNNKKNHHHPHSLKRVGLGGRGRGPLSRILNQEIRVNESLSSIQLPNLNLTLNEPSIIFSEASGIKSLQLQEFHDDSFHSGDRWVIYKVFNVGFWLP